MPAHTKTNRKTHSLTQWGKQLERQAGSHTHTPSRFLPIIHLAVLRCVQRETHNIYWFNWKWPSRCVAGAGHHGKQLAGREDLFFSLLLFIETRDLVFLINTNWFFFFVCFLFSLEQYRYRAPNIIQRMQTTTCIWMLRLVFVGVVLTMRRSSIIIYSCQNFSAWGSLSFVPEWYVCPHDIGKYVRNRWKLLSLCLFVSSCWFWIWITQQVL